MAGKSRRWFKFCKHCKRTTTWYEDQYTDPHCLACMNWDK